MRLATFATDGTPTFGFVRDDCGLVEFADACSAAAVSAPTIRGVLDVIEQWEQLEPSAAQLASVVEGSEVTVINPETVRWLPPIPRPSKIMGVAANNKMAFEAASYIEDHPILFTEPPSALNGHLEPIVIYPGYGVVHTEAELGVVIGSRVKGATLGNAMDAVFGFTIVNDVTSPDLKSADTCVFADSSMLGDSTRPDGRAAPGFEHGNMVLTYHARSKGTDTFLPCGPWITTKEQVRDPHALEVTAYLGGQLVTRDNTGNLKFSIPEVIAQISGYCTLEPGDIIHMGTAVASPKYKLRDLDYQVWDGPATLEIEGLGRLSNPIERRA